MNENNHDAELVCSRCGEVYGVDRLCGSPRCPRCGCRRFARAAIDRLRRKMVEREAARDDTALPEELSAAGNRLRGDWQGRHLRVNSVRRAVPVAAGFCYDVRITTNLPLDAREVTAIFDAGREAIASGKVEQQNRSDRGR